MASLKKWESNTEAVKIEKKKKIDSIIDTFT